MYTVKRLKENIVMRLLGLFIVLAPRRGFSYLIGTTVEAVQRVQAD